MRTPARFGTRFRFTPIDPIVLIALVSIAAGMASAAEGSSLKNSDRQAAAFRSWLQTRRFEANPFKYIHGRIELERKKEEKRRGLRERREAELKKSFRAWLEDEWVSGDPEGAIRAQRRTERELMEKLEAQVRLIEKLRADLAKEKEIDAQKGEELKKKLAAWQEAFDERKSKIEKAHADLRKRFDRAGEEARRRDRDLRATIDRLSERSTADFESVELDGISFIKIPAGTYFRGASDEQVRKLNDDGLWSDLYRSEQPRRRITISKPFLISQCEITQAIWKSYMNKNPSAFKGNDLPVESVTWEEIQRFLQKLSKKTGGHYRLPTEAEWEYCARAGSEGIFGRGADAEPIGFDNIGQYAVIADNSGGQTQSVASRSPNAWGLYDLSGNVWEWCQDWFSADYYAGSPDRDPVNRDRQVERVLRGGCWDLDAVHARAAFRGAIVPDRRSQYAGLRVVRDLARE